jgi:hypothetical protein
MDKKLEELWERNWQLVCERNELKNKLEIIQDLLYKTHITIKEFEMIMRIMECD